MPAAYANRSKLLPSSTAFTSSEHTSNESGAKLARPELFRLLADSKPGDILLVEAVDRLSRLTASDWQTLRTTLTAQRIKVVALPLMVKDVCSPNSSGQKPSPKPLPHADPASRGAKHAAVYGEYDGKQRSDQSTQQLPPSPQTNPGGR